MASTKPTQTSLSLNYSVGMKANIGNYESTDVHISRSETWDVTSLAKPDVNALYEERFKEIKVELDALITTEYEEAKSG